MRGSKAFLFATMAVAMAGDYSKQFNSFIEAAPPVPDEKLREAEIARNLKRGLKEFIYGQGSIWARDQKNADRKAKNNGWI